VDRLRKPRGRRGASAYGAQQAFSRGGARVSNAPRTVIYRIRQESPLGRLRSSTQRTYARTHRRRREREGLGYGQRQMPAGQPASGMCAQVAANHRTRPPASSCMLKPPIRALPETIAPNGQ
jgi:hypothetical protein